MMRTDTLALYIHIPFCVKKCSYCDFCSESNADFRRMDLYVDALCTEIAEYKGEDRLVDTVFFGGGTPSLLPASLFEKIVFTLRNTFNVSDKCEFSVEANPNTLCKDKIDTYVSLGVNRISIGLQSANDSELKALGRIHNYSDFLESYNLLRKSGISNVNVDIMYGIPYQSVSSFSHTLNEVVKLSPEHISVYGLIVEEGTPLASSPLLSKLPSEDEECDMYYTACEVLARAGYGHYEISNYAKVAKECRHNLKYWRDEEYIGLGLSAYSYYRGERFGNTSDFDKYVSSLSKKAYSEIITPIDETYEYSMLRLRLSEGINLVDYKSRFGEDFIKNREAVIKKYSDMSLLSLAGDRLSLTEKGFYVSNTILSELL